MDIVAALPLLHSGRDLVLGRSVGAPADLVQDRLARLPAARSMAAVERAGVTRPRQQPRGQKGRLKRPPDRAGNAWQWCSRHQATDALQCCRHFVLVAAPHGRSAWRRAASTCSGVNCSKPRCDLRATRFRSSGSRPTSDAHWPLLEATSFSIHIQALCKRKLAVRTAM